MNRLTHLKMLVFGMLMMLVCLAAGTGRSMAAVQAEDVSLGGICPGMTYEEITAIYGAPTREERGYAQLVHKVIFYGSDVEIGFCGKKVLYVTVTADNGWRTPQGFHAGMNVLDAIRICGQDYIVVSSPKQRTDNSPFFESRWQGVRYKYQCAAPDGVYSYEPGDNTWEISFAAKSIDAASVDAITIRAYPPEK